MKAKKVTTLLAGHELPWEGRLNVWTGSRNGEGRAQCSCGKWSPTLPSTAARQRWHRGHKDEVRAERELGTDAAARGETPGGAS